jgi:hypothetical protein
MVALQNESSLADAKVRYADGDLLVTLTFAAPPSKWVMEDDEQKRRADLRPRLQAELGDRPVAIALVSESILRFSDALASEPFYLTIPEHTPRSAYREREYEYFFSSQTLMIFTDIIGFGIIAFLVAMEKKGVLHRAGAEEDLNR